MPIYKLNIQWRKERFSNVECNTDEGADKFKAVLFSLTGVPPERQKIMLSGKILEDDFEGFKLKDGSKVMLLGTTDILPAAKEIDHNHDTAPSKVADDNPLLPKGLNNLGNTCYANAAVQLLYSVSELRSFLRVSPLSLSPQDLTSPDALVSSLKSLFQSMESSVTEIIPFVFISCLRTICPQFATTVENESQKDSNPMLSMLGGKFAQQDANECWLALMGFLQNVTFNPRLVQVMPPVFHLSSLSNDSEWNVVDRYFTGKMRTKLNCTESPTASDEASSQAVDSTDSEQSFTQLSCYINQDVRFLHTGLKNNFEGTLTKHSPVLGRDAVYKKVSSLTRLPGYLLIHFVRFFYKESKKLSAKVLKDVKFPLELDMFTFCSEELKQRLTPMREKMRLAEEAQSTMPVGRNSARQKAKHVDPEKNPELFELYSLADDPGSNSSGFYELQGVLSHQGRTSASGHYAAWVKVSGTWMMFDDELVTPVTEEDVLKLSGGGEYHSAYLLLYAPKRLLKQAVGGDGTSAL